MMDDLLEEMVNPAPAQADRARRRRLWATVTIVGLAAVGVTSLTTSALFTDNETTSDAIKTGSVNLTMDAVSFSVPVDNMLPGASIVAPIEVRNAGSLRYQYAISYEAENGAGNGTGALTDRLRLAIFTRTAGNCTLDGTTSATGRIGRSSSTNAFGLATSLTPIVGDPADYANAENRFLSATESEDLCVRIDFDVDADNTYQDTSATLTLKFDARQLDFDPSQPDESGVTGP
ncbi:TasA family protein [Cellulomonas persica]|uniref:DAD domain-containing protein n=1 Tax=Cellulomonas persica TaxID=76861 RepID=A0A510UX86_9CELL|nr:TasA family protein [Cellulomonas persica]GEK17405.1 hypothetical protein CPE01_11380 [Cellulomonas persica]